MKNLFLGILFKFIGKKLDGYKTKIGGIVSILTGILGIIGNIWPDLTTVQLSTETSLGFIAAGFTALGLGGKLEKVKGILENGNTNEEVKQ
jgi:hypothetical protein